MRFHALLPLALTGCALALPAPQPEEVDRRSWPSVTSFLSHVADLFPASMLIQDACGLINHGEKIIGTIFDISSTDNTGCGDVTVLFARGTCDAGNVGVLVGPWFIKALGSALSATGQSLGAQGLDYPASVEGYLTGSVGPGQDFANLIQNTVAQCPDTKIVLGGYSQGGIVVHNAAADLDPSIMAKVSAVVIFGDPYSKQAVANIDPSLVDVICHEGDNICDNGPIILPQHLTYAEDAGAAASFVMSVLS